MNQISKETEAPFKICKDCNLIAVGPIADFCYSCLIKILEKAGGKFIDGQWKFPFYRRDKGPEMLPVESWKMARTKAADEIDLLRAMEKAAKNIKAEHDTITRGDRSEYHDPECGLCGLQKALNEAKRQ